MSAPASTPWQGLVTPQLETRFWSLIDRSDSCWTWAKAPTRGGYGRITIWHERRWIHVLAHRLSYYLAHRSLDPALTIDHLCRNRLCVRPSHLEQVPGVVNVKRGVKPNKTACVHGHRYTPENTYIHPKRGTRQCRECARISNARRWAQRKEAA